MGSEANRTRQKWQDYSLSNANEAEGQFDEVLTSHFINSDFRVRAKPSEFSKLYVGYELSPQVAREIYTPPEPVKRHGVFPDFAIDCLSTQRTMYVEVKRQDGWVEGGKRADGRGNAHERSCKFFTPGLQNALRAAGKIPYPHLPFWVVFQGDITRDPCRVREISMWYSGHEAHCFLWRKNAGDSALTTHFDDFIKPILLGS